jgi:predicted secreted protein
MHEKVLSATLQLGQTLLVLTNTEPLSAFHWDIKPLRTSVIKSTEGAKLIPADERGLLGGEVRTQFSFVAMEKGTATINFVFSFHDVQRDCFMLNVIVK